jgi:hypothetical protein
MILFQFLLSYSLILKIEAVFFPETSVNFSKTTGRQIPKDSILETEEILPAHT